MDLSRSIKRLIAIREWIKIQNRTFFFGGGMSIHLPAVLGIYQATKFLTHTQVCKNNINNPIRLMGYTPVMT